VVFHWKLGTYREKAERIERLAGWIARNALGAGDETARHAAQAARLSKADLTTDMVREFTELQGTMGGIYAREERLPEEVWKAIYFHYLPVGVEADDPPSRAALGRGAIAWAAVSLADKLDTVAGLFAAGEPFSGSRDPFGMRRQAHGVLRILIDLPELTGLDRDVALEPLLDEAGKPFAHLDGRPGFESEPQAFWDERLRYVLEQRGSSREQVRAVLAADSLVPLTSRRKLEVLPEFTGSPAFKQLATTFKRVKNIARELKDEDPVPLDRLAAVLSEPAEGQLLRDLLERIPQARAAAARHDYRRALTELAALGPAVDRFFVEVLVMAEDAGVRRARLSLLAHLRDVVLDIADVSELVAEPA
jgi:glycyl-tRNA synthetase beta chain